MPNIAFLYSDPEGLQYFEHKKALWPESTSELYRSSDCRLSAKPVTTFADRGCRVVSATGGAVGEMNGKKTEVLGENLPQ
jgi:hypothetical protein